jgi:hypothetical protein
LHLAIQAAEQYQDNCELEDSLTNLRQLYAEQGKLNDAAVVESQARLASIGCLIQTGIIWEYVPVIVGIVLLLLSIKLILKIFHKN